MFDFFPQLAPLKAIRAQLFDLLPISLPKTTSSLGPPFNFSTNIMISLVPGEGLEPPTFGLQNRCTATVLTRRILLINMRDARSSMA